MLNRIRRLLSGARTVPASYEPLTLAEPLDPVSHNPEPIQAAPIQPDTRMTTQSDALMDALNRLGGSFKTRLDEARATVDGMSYGKGEQAFSDDIASLRTALDNLGHHADAMTATAGAVATMSPAAALSGVSVNMTDTGSAPKRKR